MNTHALIPLIATIAYIPLFGILLSNRPWDRKRRLFLLFLIPAILWSFTDILFRGDFFIQDKLLLFKFGTCFAIWMVVQFHYLVCSFYRPQGVKIPLAYAFLIGVITLAVLGYIPRSIEVAPGSISVAYGIWIIIIGLFMAFALGARDIYSLVRRHRVSVDPQERNRIVYLIAATGIFVVFLLSSFAPRGGEYPVSHIGNLANAGILTYAVVRYKLLDVRVAFRQTLSFIGMAIFPLATFLAWLLLLQRAFSLELSFTAITIAALCTAAIVAPLWQRVRNVVFERTDRALYGERVEPRRRLFDFMSKIYDVPTLEQFGNRLVSLLSQSIDCRRACLLLPQGRNGDFVVRFNYPPVRDDPMSEMVLRHDSPIVTWLRQEAQGLSRSQVDILPEFQGLWQEEKENIQAAKVEMFIPLIHGDKLVATLAVGSKRRGKLYTVGDIDLMESVVNQVAVSMEKEYLHEQLQEQGKELALINHLSAIATSSVNISDIFETFAQGLREVVDVDYAVIALIEGSQLRIGALSSQVNSARQVEETIPLEGTTTEWVTEHKESLYEDNLEQHRRFRTAEHYIREGIRSIVHLPLVVKDDVIGTLIVGCHHPNAYSSRQIQILEHLALQIAMPIENSQLYAKAEHRARVDELTGLFNRRYFEERLKEEIARHSRYNDAFSLLMVDLDTFKDYNDMHGHPAGDRLLNQIGRIIRYAIRGTDQAFRYGGDEFIIILPQTTIDDAYMVAERVRESIAAEMKAKGAMVTCSEGLANYPSDGTMYGELIGAADTALYYAKRTGGNRIYLSSKILSEPAIEEGANARRGGLSTVYALVAAVDAKDHYTYSHSRKVNVYAVTLAETIGLSPEEVSKISATALLHDIGKIGIPDKMLNKKGKLNQEEWEAVKAHPRLGANIVRNVPGLISCVNGILYHHERWDGSGYPEELKGDGIPLDARIMAIADAFAAMTSLRPYRGALCREKAIKQLRRGAGKQFDPKLAGVFIGMVDNGLYYKVEAGEGLPSEPVAS